MRRFCKIMRLVVYAVFAASLWLFIKHLTVPHTELFSAVAWPAWCLFLMFINARSVAGITSDLESMG